MPSFRSSGGQRYGAFDSVVRGSYIFVLNTRYLLFPRFISHHSCRIHQSFSTIIKEIAGHIINGALYNLHSAATQLIFTRFVPTSSYIVHLQTKSILSAKIFEIRLASRKRTKKRTITGCPCLRHGQSHKQKGCLEMCLRRYVGLC